MTTYKLLALDMDGTLLTSDKRMSARTIEALHRIADRGVHVCLSTGRAAVELEDYRDDMQGTIGLASLLSGGHILDLASRTTIAALPFETDTALGVMPDLGLSAHSSASAVFVFVYVRIRLCYPDSALCRPENELYRQNENHCAKNQSYYFHG